MSPEQIILVPGETILTDQQQNINSIILHNNNIKIHFIGHGENNNTMF